MGFYLRKSISVGPFRFNLSKSGVGVSAGVKGFRVGTGPRGNYVHIGAKGLYYRTTITSPSQRKGSQNTNKYSLDSDHVVSNSSTHEVLEDIESADVSQIVDSSSEELLQELNSKKKKNSFWPFVLALFLFLVIVSFRVPWPLWASISICVVGSLLTGVTYSRDLLNKTTVLFYDFDSEMESAYSSFLSAAEKLQSCSKKWHIAASGRVLDKKYHAGASDLVNRNETTISISEPPLLKTNIKSVAIGVGRQTLHFFPDRVFVFDSNGVGAVNYNDLNLNVERQQFIEDGSVPRDADVVGQTWKYVNKSGGPDRRFRDNHQIPVCLYENIAFTSNSGLNELIQLSSCGNAQLFQKAISKVSQSLPNEISNSESVA
ncbi:DUF4236 domain-containing protein [Neptunicella marina]|uniref:DUF4236 domain-containing protein n=1 Tax=Neptunicella marina TaxID=2125989 RepID=A0A8J6IRP6_9ALTE|nr:DUF4236 domain-containing protein [Neptunicella marina]MBC3765556.1 DUF4236 domain-containing protein [Neptunicella marina]